MQTRLLSELMAARLGGLDQPGRALGRFSRREKARRQPACSAGDPAAHRSAGSTRSAASLKWRSIVLLAAVAAEVFPMPAWLMIARADALTRRRFGSGQAPAMVIPRASAV